MAARINFQTKHIQAVLVVAGALSLLAIASWMSRREANELATNQRTLSGSENQAPDGGNLFSLPQASPDFVGTWYGVMPAIRREPPNWGTESQSFGTAFFLDNGRVVMKLALWVTPTQRSRNCARPASTRSMSASKTKSPRRIPAVRRYGSANKAILF